MDQAWPPSRIHGSTGPMRLHLIKACYLALITLHSFLVIINSVYTEFYLILSVAVGSTNGWFPESQGNKPWLDHAECACIACLLISYCSLMRHTFVGPMCDFVANQDQWYPTWPTNVEERAMVVYVLSDPCYVVCGADPF